MSEESVWDALETDPSRLETLVGASEPVEGNPEDAPSGECDVNYEGACVPADVGDVDCTEILETDFDVVGVDVYGLDGDGDGIACQS